MSRDYSRSSFYGRDRDRDREWDLRGPNDRNREIQGSAMSRRRSRSHSPRPRDIDKRRIRTPRSDKDMIDDNILNEISKLPEPSELWDNNQLQEIGYTATPNSPSSHIEQPNQSYGSNYRSICEIYGDFPSTTSKSLHPPDISTCTALSLSVLPEPVYTPEDQLAVVKVSTDSGNRNRKIVLSKKKADHMNKAALLKIELETLKDQRNELRGDGQRSPSPETKRFLKENTKLQLEIQNKLKTINNVVDMLNGIIEEEAQGSPEPDDTPKPRLSPLSQKFNYVYYDPEMHWCRVCNEFPSTAKDYLNHLHSPSHYETAAQHMEAPWHSLAGTNEGFPTVPAAPTKRTPIRGLQFFVPQTGWYCKLCDQFIGDLHCASAHLKSVLHSKNYSSFVQQNPHWETDWMSDRQRAFERAQTLAVSAAVPAQPAAAPAPAPPPPSAKPAEDKGSRTVHYTTHTVTVSKEEYNSKMEEKKKNRKKRDSSLSSSSDSSEGTRKRAKSKRLKKVDDEALEELIAINDRKLFENIKGRIKTNVEGRQRSTSRERRQILQMQRKIRESERRGLPRESEDRRDNRYDSPDHRGRRDTSRDRRANSRDRRDSSRDRRANSRDRRGNSRDRQANSWDRRDTSRDRQANSRDRRDVSRDRQEGSRDRRASSRDRQGGSRSRRDTSRDQMDKSRSPDRREHKPDIKKMIVIGKMPFYKSQTEEQRKEEQRKKEDAVRTEKVMADMQKMLPAIALSAALNATMPEPKAAAPLPSGPPLAPAPSLPPTLPPTSVQPNAILPTAPVVPNHQLPIPLSQLPEDPKDFQQALEAMFPTDPMKCAEKVEQELMQQAMQQPGLLGPAPTSLLGMSAFAPSLGLLQGGTMFGFDPSAALFAQQRALLNPGIPRMPNTRQNNLRPSLPYQNRNRNNQTTTPRRAPVANQRTPVTNQRTSAANQRTPAANQKTVKKDTPVMKEIIDAKMKELDDLAMLGIDAGDVVV